MRHLQSPGASGDRLGAFSVAVSGFRVLGLRVCLQRGPNNMRLERQAFAWVLHAFNRFCLGFHDLAQCDRALTGVHKNLFRYIKRFISGLNFFLGHTAM